MVVKISYCPASRSEFWQAVLDNPVPRQDFELVPLSQKVALSRLVGNTSLNMKPETQIVKRI